MNPYEIIESKITYRGKIIDVKQDTITLPDGRQAMREIILKGDAAAIIPIDSDNNVIFVKQYRHAIEQMSIEIPAGVLDDGESDPRACAIRELEEETGLKAGHVEFLMKMHPGIGCLDETIYIYAARELSAGQTNYDADEFIEIVKYPLQKAIEMVFSGEITDSKSIAALLAVSGRTK